MATISELTLRNFKSFKAVRIPLSAGFNCIIGPNGSGKSNTCDAIRFIFGESSLRALRGRSVNDLIHGGGDKASIVMKLSDIHGTNGDGEKSGNAEIIRKLRKNGGTAYWLNGKRATKSVVMDFLQSEGLEVSSHNVIAQGEVDKIVRFTPKERRAVIDEIAGVSEFEDKKREALSELGKVDQRLNEASVVMNEREGILQELEKEKDTALKFLALKDEQKKLKGTIVLTQYRKLEKEFEASIKRLKTIEEEMRDIEHQMHDADTRLVELDSKKNEIGSKIASKDQKNVYAEVEDLRGKITVIQSVMSEKEAALQKVTSELEKLTVEIKEVNEKLSSFTGAKRTAATRAVELKKMLEHLVKQKSIVVSEWEEKRKNFGMFDTKLDDLRKRQASVREELAKLTTKFEMSVPAGDKETLGKELTEVRKSIEKGTSGIESLFKQEKDMNKRLRELDSEILTMKEEMAVARGSGTAMPQAVAFVIGLKSELPGIFGTVAELYDTDKKYSIATEAAAGGRLFHIVVQDVKTATEIIKRMKQSGVGRATFIPLDVKSVDKKAPHSGTLGPVLDVIKFEKQYSGVFNFVFGNTHIVNNVDDFKKISGVRMATLDGDITEASGVVTGGTSVKRSVREGLKTNQMEKELAEMKMVREGCVTELYSLNEKMSLFRRQIAKDEVRKKELEIELGMAATGKDLSAVKNDIIQRQTDIDDMGRDILNLEGEKARIRVAIEQGEGEKELSRLDSEFVSCSTELSAIEEKLKSQDSIILEERSAAIKKSLDQNTDEKKELDKAMAEHNSKLKQYSKQLEAKEEKIKDAGRELDKLYAESKVVQDKIDILNQEKGKFMRRTERIKEDKIRIEAAKEANQTRLVDLKVEADQYKDVEPLNMKREELDQRMLEVENEIQSIGFANLKAPETYKEKLGEYNQIKDKVSILSNEKDSVMKMIDEIELRKKDVFMKTFLAVNEHFKKMATSIFGNESSLVLENEANPFDGGLHILMKVGKKERHIESMSGGEKSLLTIAFVFALHMYQPSSFYILDEVEAALDKENSKKFANLVKELSSQAQFIVVSHNDNVIPFADVALGVTKTKLGSKIVSVKLTNGTTPPATSS